MATPTPVSDISARLVLTIRCATCKWGAQITGTHRVEMIAFLEARCLHHNEIAHPEIFAPVLTEIR